MRRRNESGFPYRAQVLERSFVILNVLAEGAEDLSLAEIEQKVKMNKSTSYRLLRTLEHHRFAEKDSRTGKYRLGSKLLELGVRALARFDLPTIARPYLEKLSGLTGETSRLGVLTGHEVVSIAVEKGRHVLQMSTTVGGKAPVHCSALGKAILALLPERELEAILRKHRLKAYTRNTITRSLALRTELEEVRKHGFSVDDQELEHGLKCIGAPVLDHSGKVVAAVSIAGAAVRLTKKRVSVVAPLVARIASEFSFSLGYRATAISSLGNQEPISFRHR